MKFKNILVMGILSFLLAPKAGAQTFSEACYTPGLTRFQLFAPDNAKQVTLRIYDDGQGGKPVKTVKMKRTAAETYSAELKGDLKGKFYTFDTGGRRVRRSVCQGSGSKRTESSHHRHVCH